jgi:environmental stress-induced protein Ves
VSLATIAEDGAFSEFPGVERTLALVDGHGMTLEIDGERCCCRRPTRWRSSTANRAWWPSSIAAQHRLQRDDAHATAATTSSAGAC